MFKTYRYNSLLFFVIGHIINKGCGQYFVHILFVHIDSL